ncbi:hypothetical protein [Streptomyces carpaticus]|uniref:MarR family transcriptional regulator n=1 Tax=Streptomyces carpaticus TaxID=285558 RepID=A0ABV4ZGW4_9ACTN
MRTTPITPAETDAWITVLYDRGHLHRAERGPEDAWTVQRTPASRSRTLPDPASAMDYIAEVLRDIRRQAPETPR